MNLFIPVSLPNCTGSVTTEPVVGSNTTSLIFPTPSITSKVATLTPSLTDEEAVGNW